MSRRLAAALIAALALSHTKAAEPPPTPAQVTAVGSELNAIRDQLVALDIEKALYALNAILERSDLTEATRVDALDLRSQAYGASDDLDAAEVDYRAILALRPGYAPNPEATSKKAMDRFLRIRASMIGTLRADLDPADASVTVDGRSASVSADGGIPAVSGVRRLHVSRKGFDPKEADVEIVAARETTVSIHLVPNARSLVARTDIDGVAVTLDGIVAGLTARGAEAAAHASAPATLLIPDVAIGEHELAFSKPCFATESLQEVVSVDLSDRSPKLTRIIAMRPSRTRVAVTGGAYEGELYVDGERVASLPLTSFAMCPGLRTLEVVASGRVVWSGVSAAEESEVTLDLTPRPSAVLIGAAWPKTWTASTAAWSLRSRVDPPDGLDLTKREAWAQLTLPSGTDLAVAVIPGAGIAGDERIVLYGPALLEVDEPLAPPRASPPSWTVSTLGVVLVDAGRGSVTISSIAPSSPAARAGLLPGDRLVAVAGRAVATAASAREAIGAPAVSAKLAIEVAGPGGQARKVECETAVEPRIAPFEDGASRVVRAAWASVEAAAGGPNAAAALANLAMLLERSGREPAALDAWRRVRGIAGGSLAARASYAIGAGLESSGKRAEAIQAFTQAKSEALSSADPVLAAAAADRLRDLGVTPR